MIFVKNLKFLLSLSFFEKDLDTMFNNALKGKIGFPDKTRHFNTMGNVHFSKGVNPWFWPKIENFFLSCFSLKKKRPWYDIWWCSRKKRGLSRLKKCHFRIIKKHFSKEFGQIFFEFVFLRKKRDDVLDRKEGSLNNKSVIWK